ncbi:RNA polymerase sigma factor [Arachidicoccus ginsenosidivorans]
MNRYKEHTDLELMDLLKNGDEIAFNEIYDRYWKLLFAVAASKLNDFTDAEEAVQDIFADLWKRKAKIVLTYSLKSYLAGAVKYRVYEALGLRQRLLEKKAALMGSTRELMTNSVEEAYRLKILQEEILQAANQLPDKCRLIYKLSRENGYSNKKIASVLSLSEKTVENQITRALHFLRKKLSPSIQGLPFFLYILSQLKG